jgi:ribosomal protein L11 methyltransferase
MEELSLAGPWTMLDVGTGSGILAAYGALLGAERVLALDMDEEALRWAKKNIRLNDLTDAVLLSTKPVEALKGTFSLLAANLFLKEILRLLPHLTRLLKPGGWLILSGMLRGQVHEVEEALGSLPYEAVRRLFQKEWACTVSRKKMGLDS